MRRGHGARRGVALGALSLVYLLASCAPRVEGPAPVTSGEMVEAPISMTIQSGQTLSGIAHAYHVPMRVIADANGLSPPYRIQAGHTLIIPGSNRLRNPAPTVSVAALPPAGNELPLPATKLQVPTSPGNGQAEPVDHPVTTSPEGSPRWPHRHCHRPRRPRARRRRPLLSPLQRQPHLLPYNPRLPHPQAPSRPRRLPRFAAAARSFGRFGAISLRFMAREATAPTTTGSISLPRKERQSKRQKREPWHIPAMSSAVTAI